MPPLPRTFVLSSEIALALKRKAPVVALESTVITHGLPHPENLALARDMEMEVRKHGGIPATVAVLDGKIHVGLDAVQLKRLAMEKSPRKISIRDFGTAIAKGECGGTTVAGTLFAAHKAGIHVFATGGIGGVHREPPFDVSADLPQLSRTPMVVVCAGAKAILDLPATLEYLETVGVPVIGYQTDEFPAFYSRRPKQVVGGGHPTSARANSPAEAAALAQTHWELGMKSALLVVVPPPAETALPAEEVDGAIQQALDEAKQKNIRGQAVTPFLLSRVSELTKKASLQANLGLLRNNAKVAAQIAGEWGVGR
ncbi:MAG: pseudouridine-5'-phosphate glycosidase [Anaerolineales bacterium]